MNPLLTHPLAAAAPAGQQPSAVPSLIEHTVTAYDLLAALAARIDGMRPGPAGQADGCGPCCRRGLPSAMLIEVAYLLANCHLLSTPIEEIRDLSLAWLIRPEPGLQLWESIRGRPYRLEERLVLEEDGALLRQSPCPFLAGEVCLLGRLRPLACHAHGLTPGGAAGGAAIRLQGRLMGHLLRWLPGQAMTSWLPGLLARALARDEVLALQAEGRIPDIKLAVASHPPRLWPERGDGDS